MKVSALILFVLGISFLGVSPHIILAQKTTRVIVIDSLSFEPLPAVFVRVKNTKISLLADPSGIFTITTKSADTLLITHIGYNDIILPLLFEEDALLVRMREKVIMLGEVTITSRRLYPNELNPRISSLPRTRALTESLAAPWEYFNKREKEKRKLVRLMQENDQVKTFMEVITDPSIKAELMDTYVLSEEMYYNLLVKFNQKKLPVIYSSDSEKIIEALHEFFERESQ